MSIATNCPNAPCYADQVINALHCAQGPESVVFALDQFVFSLGGIPEAMRGMTPAAQSLYVAALIVRASA